MRKETRSWRITVSAMFTLSRARSLNVKQGIAPGLGSLPDSLLYLAGYLIQATGDNGS